MSYLSREQSVHAARPLELYRFVLGAERWLYTSAQRAQSHLGESYLPAAISRSGIEQSSELARAGIEVTVARDAAVARQFVAAAPDGVLGLTLYRLHEGDGEVVTIWKGRVTGVTMAGSSARLQCEPIATSLRRAGLRARYQLLCRHALYSSGCGALKSAHRVDGSVASVTGVSVQVAAAASRPDGHFVAGYLSSSAGRRMIVGHVGITLTLSAPLIGLSSGLPVELYAGCDHTLGTCDGRFDNGDNFGGFPWIPIKNPFAGDALV